MERWFQKLKGEGWTDLQAERLAPDMENAYQNGRADATADCICLVQRKLNVVYVMVGANLGLLFVVFVAGAFHVLK